MEDAEFLRRMQERIQESTGMTVDLEVGQENGGAIEVHLSPAIPRIVVGADALQYPGLARMFLQYAILCLRQGRKATNQELLLFLRRN